MGCMFIVAITSMTGVFWSPNSDDQIWRLNPGDKACVVEVVPGQHPLGVHWIRDGQRHGGYIDSAQRPTVPSDG
jgi:hypothetical protein